MKTKLKSGSSFEIVDSNETSILSVSEAGSVTIAGTAVATQGEVPTKTSDLTNDSGFITGVSWEQVTDKPTFATVAETGSYNDLEDKPTIPTIPTSLKNPNAITIKAGSDTVSSYDGSAAKTFTVAASSTAGAFTISDGTTTKTIQLLKTLY